jgi:hypothetical protein
MNTLYTLLWNRRFVFRIKQPVDFIHRQLLEPMAAAPAMSFKMFLPIVEKPCDRIGQGYYTSRYQHATAIFLPLLKRVRKEDTALALSTSNSTTSLLIVNLASSTGTINIHIGRRRLADSPSNKKVVSSPYNLSYPHDIKVEILMLSVRSI